MKRYLPIIVLAVILAIAIPVLRHFRSQGISPGQRAPEFTLNDLEGNPVSLSDFRGSVLMLNFWSPFCGPCREEMPDMQEVYDELKEESFSILAVNVYPTPDDAANFIRENGFTFPVVHGNPSVTGLYEVTFIPKTLIIDRDGIVRQVGVGSLSAAQLRQMVSEWL